MSEFYKHLEKNWDRLTGKEQERIHAPCKAELAALRCQLAEAQARAEAAEAAMRGALTGLANVQEELATVTRERDGMREAVKAANGILWMAEEYADAGGRHSIEREEFDEARKLITSALDQSGGAA